MTSGYEGYSQDSFLAYTGQDLALLVFIGIGLIVFGVALFRILRAN